MQPLVSAVDNYISDWCGKILTPSGRTILANAVLGARALYAMCSTLLLKGTIEAVDAQRQAFIWTGDDHCSGGQCKAAWDMVCWDKEQGGLGVKNLSIQNRGLMLKFLDKLHRPPTTSWQRWFHRMYGYTSQHDFGDPHHLDTPVWHSVLQLLPDFRAATSVHLGNGQTTAFWLDHWLGPLPVAQMFPALFSHLSLPKTQHRYGHSSSGNSTRAPSPPTPFCRGPTGTQSATSSPAISATPASARPQGHGLDDGTLLLCSILFPLHGTPADGFGTTRRHPKPSTSSGSSITGACQRQLFFTTATSSSHPCAPSAALKSPRSTCYCIAQEHGPSGGPSAGRQHPTSTQRKNFGPCPRSITCRPTLPQLS
ncbi:unnamed protein product [Urochloa humidicola]